MDEYRRIILSFDQDIYLSDDAVSLLRSINDGVGTYYMPKEIVSEIHKKLIPLLNFCIQNDILYLCERIDLRNKISKNHDFERIDANVLETVEIIKPMNDLSFDYFSLEPFTEGA